jgi:signal transduction histidine kinase
LNAVHHAFPGEREGRITIAARPIEAGEVEITIADDGVGMSADVKRQAFDPFFTTRRNAGGTGLGLHIVYNLVTQQLGGTLELESWHGQGTTLRMILPRLAPREAPARLADSDGSEQWQNATISSA